MRLNLRIRSVFVCGIGVLFLPGAAFPQGLAVKAQAASAARLLNGESGHQAGYEPLNRDGTINVVVESPAGTMGEPDSFRYLGYPVNYGVIPRSVAGKKKEGGGKALSALVLGPAVPAGTVVRGRLIGVLGFPGAGAAEAKVIVSMAESPFGAVAGMADLDSKFPGVTTIIKTWFTYYKGRGDTTGQLVPSVGFGGRAEAIKLAGDAILAFETSAVTEADKRPLDENGDPYLYLWPGAKNTGE